MRPPNFAPLATCAQAATKKSQNRLDVRDPRLRGQQVQNCLPATLQERGEGRGHPDSGAEVADT